MKRQYPQPPILVKIDNESLRQANTAHWVWVCDGPIIDWSDKDHPPTAAPAGHWRWQEPLSVSVKKQLKTWTLREANGDDD